VPKPQPDQKTHRGAPPASANEVLEQFHDFPRVIPFYQRFRRVFSRLPLTHEPSALTLDGIGAGTGTSGMSWGATRTGGAARQVPCSNEFGRAGRFFFTTPLFFGRIVKV
jgi:hypothetical protein